MLQQVEKASFALSLDLSKALNAWRKALEKAGSTDPVKDSERTWRVYIEALNQKLAETSG
jgi:hypothetical protein